MNNHMLIEDHDDVYTIRASSKYNQNRAKFDWDANGSNSGQSSAALRFCLGLGEQDKRASRDNGGGAIQKQCRLIKIRHKSAGGDVALIDMPRINRAGNAESPPRYQPDWASASHDLSVAIDYGGS